MTAIRANAFLISCEHGGNRIPAAYRPLFRGLRTLLNTHRGYDPGALRVAQDLASALQAALVTSTTSRLLIDLNRSPGHPQLFSSATRDAPPLIRSQIARDFYLPYRMRVEQCVRKAIARGCRVIHISSHSFTPVLKGIARNAEVGLLYDPARRSESELCARWKAALAVRAPAFRVRRNYPYAGKADGLTSHLRRLFSHDTYIGIELEVNQRIVRNAGPRWTFMRLALIESLRMACSGAAPSQPVTPGDP